MSSLSALESPIERSAVRHQRARGSARVSFKRSEAGPTRLDELWQDGSCKVRLPHVYDARGPVAVLLNTAGGITGGDHLLYEASWGPGARATVTSQAAERIYRRSEGVGRVDSRLTLGPGAEGRWLPQETILFDRTALSRTLTVELAADSVFVGCESFVFGRTAMGEDVLETRLHDAWRVLRGGRLVFADSLRIAGDSRAVFAGGATGRGARAIATVVRAAPDAEARLPDLRALLDAAPADVEAGASAFDGLLVTRILASDGRALRRLLEPVLTFLTDGPLPRVWAI